jgi:hypothetical protein
LFCFERDPHGLYFLPFQKAPKQLLKIFTVASMYNPEAQRRGHLLKCYPESNSALDFGLRLDIA